MIINLKCDRIIIWQKLLRNWVSQFPSICLNWRLEIGVWEKPFLKIDAIIKKLESLINTEAIAQTLNTSLRYQYTPYVIVIEI